MKRRYWIDPDVVEAEVEVTVVEPCKVATDPILFHPDEGGQPADKGTIGEASVCRVDVVDGRVIHTLDRPLSDGRYVARLDKEHRLYTAGQHTAQHILSGIAARQFGLETVGVHIGVDGCTVDFDKKVDWETAESLERRAMDVVVGDIPVETVFNEEDASSRRRGEQRNVELIRVVKIGDCDSSACCGAHVRTTGQIGIIRVFDLENRRGGTRMSFLAGRKALERSQAETAVLRQLRKSAGCSTSDLPAAFDKALGNSSELAKELKRLWLLRLDELARSVSVVTAGSSRIGVHVCDIPTDLLARYAGMVAEAVGGAAVIVSGSRIAVSSQGPDALALFRRIQEVAGGKGGGSARAVNGTLDRAVTEAELAAILGGGPGEAGPGQP